MSSTILHAKSAHLTELIFHLPNGGLIKIDTPCLSQIRQHIQDQPHKNESGGILLGRFLKSSKNIIIDLVTTPMSGDESGRYYFKRCAKSHQDVIDQEWIRSKGTCNYLGEWHTHPEKYPTPSIVDLKNWKKKLTSGIYVDENIYFIICGIKELAIWEGNSKNLNIVKLIPYSYESESNHS